MKTFLFFLGILACILGMLYGLCHAVSRPFIVTLIIIAWAICLWEMKRAPIQEATD